MSDAPFTFGDLVCYRYDGGRPFHHAAVLYLGKCSHPLPRGGGLVDLLHVGDPVNLGQIEHKDPAMWRRCDHLGAAPGIRDVSGTVSGPIKVSIGGGEVPATEFRFDLGRIVFDPPIVVTDDPIVIEYDEP